ncbi:PAS domain-containing protein [Fulvivirga sp. 29W222]|uniref:histidine kinase n=1 Tax=Fulvivirga marina TaxID=2494733 RepID=A0A937FT95_9BACT|nr:PAS domain-containing hybrid sensor histidine kinase/response regulator [Fulvivirga marina]MBL6445345.1 PAS domain-containing protein [Fulvivirga marina]
MNKGFKPSEKNLDEFQRYKYAIDQHSIVAITDKQGRITEVNDKFCQLSQYSREELIGQDHRIINSGHHTKEFFKDLYKTIHSGRVWKGEIKNRAKDGSFYWVATTITPLFNNEGDITSFIAVRTEITENKRIEKALSDSERKLQNANQQFKIATSAANIGIWERDLILNKTYLDKISCSLHGIKNKDSMKLSDKSWYDFIHPEDILRVRKNYEELLRSKNQFEINYRVIRKDQSLKYIKSYGIVERDEKGVALRMIGALIDETKQRQTEKILLEREENYRRENKLLEESQAVAKLGGWELDIETGNLYWTTETYRIHDTSPEEFNPTVDAGVGYFLPESKRIISEALEVAMSEGKGYDLILETYTTKGRKITVRTTCKVTFVDNKPAKLGGIFQDISDQVLKEDELKNAKEKAEENDRLKSAFLANMRHEIRTPLNAVIGFSKQLVNPETTETERKEFGRYVINGANQLLSLIEDITSFSLLETNQVHVNESEVNINQLLRDLEVQFKPEAETRGLNINLANALPDYESVINTDNSKLSRIITNLLSNALKFTHKGEIKFGYTVKETNLIFFVEDTGIGISPENKAKVFDSFQQADGSIRRTYGGTGLGLSICKGLIEVIGGKIWVESTLGKGSTFYFSIPFKQVVQTKELFANEELNSGIPTILIAEDQFINFHYLKVIFQKRFECDILHAANGEEAVKLFKSNPKIDLVLMDISMPIMDGFDAANLINQLNSEVPIIAQTGYDIESNEKYSPDIFSGYISKPIDQEKLFAKISIHVSID